MSEKQSAGRARLFENLRYEALDSEDGPEQRKRNKHFTEKQALAFRDMAAQSMRLRG